MSDAIVAWMVTGVRQEIQRSIRTESRVSQAHGGIAGAKVWAWVHGTRGRDTAYPTQAKLEKVAMLIADVQETTGQPAERIAKALWGAVGRQLESDSPKEGEEAPAT